MDTVLRIVFGLIVAVAFIVCLMPPWLQILLCLAAGGAMICNRLKPGKTTSSRSSSRGSAPSVSSSSSSDSARSLSTSKFDLRGIRLERAKLFREKYDKLIADYELIEQCRQASRDKEFTSRLKPLQSTAKNIIRQVERKPESISRVYKFVDYYQDRAARLSEQFSELDASQLETDRVREVKSKIKDALEELSAAYDEQLERILSDQLISTEAEIKVMKQQLKSDGIERKPRVKLSKEPAGVKDELEEPDAVEEMKKELKAAVKRQAAKTVTKFLRKHF